MSAVPPPNPDSLSVLSRLSTWLGSVLNDIMRLLADPEGGQLLLAEHGWGGGAPVLPAQLLARLDQQSQAGSDPSVQAEESFAAVLIALAAFTEALVEVPDGQASGVTALELVGDVLDAAMYLRMREDHPAVWAVLRMLELIDDDGAQLANLSDLVGDTHKYLSGLVSGPGYAQSFQDYSAAIFGSVGTGLSFIPAIPKHGSHDPHGHDQTSFRSEVLYGWAPAGPADHPNLMQVLGRTLTWRLDAQLASAPATGGASGNPGIEEIVDLTFALVPAEHNQGSWGLFFRLAGATSFTIPLGAKKPDGTPTGWQLAVSSTDGVALFALFSGAHGFLRGAGSGFGASVALERPDDINGSWVIGSATGTHVEIQHARVALTVSEDSSGWLFDAGAHADHVILNIEIGGDSFLSAVLPPSLRVDTALGIGADNRRGFYLNGGVALVVDLPVNVTIGPADVLALKVQGLHLRISLSEDQGSSGSSGSSGSGTSFAIGLTVDAEVEVAGGVFIATVAGTGAAFSVKQLSSGSGGDSTAGHWQPQLTGIPPTGIGVQIVADAVGGGGFIGHDPSTGEYTGALALHIDVGPVHVDVSALGMLDTRIPDHDGDWALLIIIAATFEPGFELGLGISLTGLGGVLGINHTLDSDAIAAGLRTKSLDAILFPPDPVGQAPHIFAVWRQTMPLSDGHMIVGPMAQISWGTASLCSLELAVLIELDPAPVQLVLLGSFRFSAPDETFGLVRLRADILGKLTFDPFEFMLEAELVDSRLGTFPISGGLLIAIRGGSDGFGLLSVGGFHPHFTPPAGLPTIDRLRVDISGSDNPRLRLEAYLAITTGTFQFGARAELHAAAGPLAIDGWLGLDVLIQFLPSFRFSAEISAGLSLSYDGSPVLEVSIDVLLEGPGPWHVHGYASLSLLFFTLSLPIDASWGDDAGPTAAVAQPLTLVHDALSAADGWSASLPGGTSSVVMLRTPPGPAIPAHPLAEITCHQRVIPLGLNVTHVGNQPLSAPTTVDVTGISLGGTAATGTVPANDSFAAAQFLSLSDDQALSRPSFEPMKAGLAAGSQAVDTGNATVVATTYKTIAVDGATRTQRPRWLLDLEHANAVLRPAAPTLARALPASVAVVDDTLRHIEHSAGAAQTASIAAQSAGGARLFDAVGIAGAAT
jgi:hypothetical protein